MVSLPSSLSSSSWSYQVSHRWRLAGGSAPSARASSSSGSSSATSAAALFGGAVDADAPASPPAVATIWRLPSGICTTVTRFTTCPTREAVSSAARFAKDDFDHRLSSARALSSSICSRLLIRCGFRPGVGRRPCPRPILVLFPTSATTNARQSTLVRPSVVVSAV